MGPSQLWCLYFLTICIGHPRIKLSSLANIFANLIILASLVGPISASKKPRNCHILLTSLVSGQCMYILKIMAHSNGSIILTKFTWSCFSPSSTGSKLVNNATRFSLKSWVSLKAKMQSTFFILSLIIWSYSTWMLLN